MLARRTTYILGLALTFSLAACGQQKTEKKMEGKEDAAEDTESPKKKSSDANRASDSSKDSKEQNSSKDNEEEESKDDLEDMNADSEDKLKGPLGGVNPLDLLTSNPQLLQQLMANPQLSGLINVAGGGQNPLAALQSNPQLLQQITSNPQFTSLLSGFGGLDQILKGLTGGSKTP